MAYNKMLVLQTDFGLVDGAVSAMHGVAHMVASDIQVSDLTHEIPPYDIWNASYRLYQTIKYWPADTTRSSSLSLTQALAQPAGQSPSRPSPVTTSSPQITGL